MQQAIIDIGSNSIRLTLYETDGQNFKILFREKIMAGLAGYVENGKLTSDGIACACDALCEFQSTLKTLQIENVHVFATASLRNISNTEEALLSIRAITGLNAEVVSGEEEALLGYAGAMRELHLTSGAFFDIGGASTEIVTFDAGVPTDFASFRIGSLSLYRCCVKKILPGEGSLKRLKNTIYEAIGANDDTFEPRSVLVGVGGTARAVIKLARHYYGLANECNTVTSEQINRLCEFLCRGEKEAIDLILRFEPDRIHTLLPGILVLQHIVRLFHADKVVVSRYGVREGYLCRKILRDCDAAQ